jgi:hypothetical protein
MMMIIRMGRMMRLMMMRLMSWRMNQRKWRLIYQLVEASVLNQQMLAKLGIKGLGP